MAGRALGHVEGLTTAYPAFKSEPLPIRPSVSIRSRRPGIARRRGAAKRRPSATYPPGWLVIGLLHTSYVYPFSLVVRSLEQGARYGPFLPPVGVHADRVAGRHRHHRRTHRPAPARRAEGPRG